MQRITKILDHYILTYLLEYILLHIVGKKAQSGKTTCNIDLRSTVLKTGLSLNCKQSNKINNIMLSSRQHSIEFQQTKFCIKFQINPIGNISIEYQIDLAKVITYRKKLHCRQLIYRLKKCIYYAGFVCFPQVRGI